ncbi:MAG: hypothetical protein IKY44_02375, partial [Clostridia bacterium]|nr:hypothetical protein [Clostridia bacterium]
MKVFKPLISVILCVIMIFGAVAFGAYAQESARLNVTVIAGAFSMSVDGGASEFMGESYSTSFAVVGSEYTVVAEPDGDYEFLYWKNDNGKILSTDEQYSFIFANDTNITAVYNRVSNGRGYVTFLTASKQELSRQLYSASVAADRITVANDVKKLGYIFKGWSIDGVNPIPASELQGAIKAALANGNVTVTPIYEKDLSTKYNITVTNGEGSGSYYFLSSASVTAQPSVDSRSFSYWQNENGEVVSLSRDYTFAVTGDETLTAVYGADSVNLVNRITGAFSDSDGVSFVSSRSVSDGLKLIQSGIIIVNSRSIGTDEEAFVIGATGVVK